MVVPLQKHHPYQVRFKARTTNALFSRRTRLFSNSSTVIPRQLCVLALWAPAGNAKEQLQHKFNLTNDHTKLIQLATVYFNDFVAGSNPVTDGPQRHLSIHLGRRSRTGVNMLKNVPWTVAHSLRRDNYCCMITGNSEEDGTVFLEAAHIIPQFNNKGRNDSKAYRRQSGGVWAILSMFFEGPIIEDLDENRIHLFENILTLTTHMHQLFDYLHLWLKPGEPNKYRVCVAREETRKAHSLPKYVTFSTKTDIPLPNPKYLALYALYCEVTWMSGAAEYIMDMERRH